jgi:hypothetical protein
LPATANVIIADMAMAIKFRPILLILPAPAIFIGRNDGRVYLDLGLGLLLFAATIARSHD